MSATCWYSTQYSIVIVVLCSLQYGRGFYMTQAWQRPHACSGGVAYYFFLISVVRVIYVYMCLCKESSQFIFFHFYNKELLEIDQENFLEFYENIANFFWCIHTYKTLFADSHCIWYILDPIMFQLDLIIRKQMRSIWRPGRDICGQLWSIRLSTAKSG